MANRNSLAMIGVVTLICICSIATAAQNNHQACYSFTGCGWYFLTGPNSGCQPILPPTAYDCTSPGPFTIMCRVKTTSCSPPPECPSCAQGGKPIDFADGNVLIADTDVRLPGLGGGLTLARLWRSMPYYDDQLPVGMFGSKWISTFEERMYAGGDGYMKWAGGDGSISSFGWAGLTGATNTFASVGPVKKPATFVQTSSTWTTTLQNGEQRTFDTTTGHLLSIVDRNGNTTQLTYDSQNRLVTVTDPVSRHLYFTYGNSNNKLVTAVTSDFGMSLSYAYDANSDLTQVTKPDGTTITYQYSNVGNNNYYNPYAYITTVLDSNGKVLESHTYDVHGRGTSSSRANGVGALGVTYNPNYPNVVYGVTGCCE